MLLLLYRLQEQLELEWRELQEQKHELEETKRQAKLLEEALASQAPGSRRIVYIVTYMYPSTNWGPPRSVNYIVSWQKSHLLFASIRRTFPNFWRVQSRQH